MFSHTYSPVSKVLKIGLFALSMALIIILAACGGQSESTPSQDEETATENADENAGSEEIRVVKHAMGTTEIEGTPERVVVLTNGASDDAVALGVKPVGAVKHWLGDPFYEYLQDDLEGVQVVGEETQPNLETITSLDPDLIIGSKVRHEKIYEQLTAIAPTVMSETVGDPWKENFLLYAEAMNKQEEADNIIAEWDQRVAEFKEKMGDKLLTEVSVVRFMPGVVRIMHNGFSGSILDEVGLARPESQQSDEFAVEVTKEGIAQMEGDILFYLTYETGDGEGAKVEEEWINDPLWQNLEVVKSGNVHKVSDVYWNSAGGIQAANKMLDDLYKYFLNE